MENLNSIQVPKNFVVTDECEMQNIDGGVWTYMFTTGDNDARK